MLATFVCRARWAYIVLTEECHFWLSDQASMLPDLHPLLQSLHARTVSQYEPLIIKDARSDSRLNSFPLVAGHPHLRFYAGVPLIAEGGLIFGSLAVIDSHLIEVSPQIEKALSAIGRQMVAQINHQRMIVHREKQLAKNQMIQDSKDRLLEILEITPDMILCSDTNGKLIYKNKSSKCVFGIGETTQNQSVSDFHSPEENLRLKKEAYPYAEKKGVWTGEAVVLDKENEPIVVSEVILAHRDQNKEIKQYTTIMRDLRIQKRLQTRLELLSKIDICFATSTTSKSIEEFTGEILEIVCQHLNWQAGICWKINLESEPLQLQLCSHWSAENQSVSQIPSRLAQLTLEKKKPVSMSDYEESGEPDSTIQHRIAAPIFSEEKMIGIVEFSTREDTKKVQIGRTSSKPSVNDWAFISIVGRFQSL